VLRRRRRRSCESDKENGASKCRKGRGRSKNKWYGVIQSDMRVAGAREENAEDRVKRTARTP